MTTTTYQAPPLPLGNGRGRAGGFTATGETNTQLGDRVEAALAEQFGLTPFHTDRRQGAFDLLDGNTAYEVKAVSRQATEYKAKPSKREIAEKLEYASLHGLDPAMILVVVDGSVGWVYRRDGVSASRLTDKWQFAGKLTL